MKKIYLLGFLILSQSIHATLERSLFNALAKSDLNAVQIAVDKGANVKTARNEVWESPLHKTAMYGSLEISKLLINEKADINAQDRSGQTPLHIVSKKGHLEAVRLFLTNGADPNIATYANPNRSQTPLHYAASLGNESVAKLLIEHGAHVDASDADGSNALHMAAMNGHLNIVTLLSNKIDVNKKDNNGVTPLHLAAIRGHINVARYLILKGARKDIKSSSGHMPINLARSDEMKTLLK